MSDLCTWNAQAINKQLCVAALENRFEIINASTFQFVEAQVATSRACVFENDILGL